MKARLSPRAIGVLEALPRVFSLQPSGGYHALISHSPAELQAKAWAKTGAQMQRAIEKFEASNPGRDAQ